MSASDDRRSAYMETLRDLVTLCENCHKAETEVRPDAEADLLRALRERFFGSSIIDLTVLFRRIEMPYPPDVVIPALLTYLLAPGNVEQVCQFHFEECKRRREAGP